MRPTLAGVVLLMLLAPEAFAQPTPVLSPLPTGVQAEIAAHASVDTSYLVALYLSRLAAAGAAPTQGDIDEAARLYFTNGAAATGVPTSGPGAAYFTNGAAATGVPTSGPGAAYFTNGAEVTAYSHTAPAPQATGNVSAPLVGSEPLEEDAGVQRAAASAEQTLPMSAPGVQSAPAQEVPSEPMTATGLTCSPMEIEAAMAIAREFATVAASPSATSSSQSTVSTSVARVAEAPPAFVVERAPNCPAEPPTPSSQASSLLSHVAIALSGAIGGGLIVAFWSRRRPIRLVQRR